MPECWGKSEVLKRLLQAGKMGSLAVVRKSKKGLQRSAKLYTPDELEENFWARCSFSLDACWNWQGPVNGGGYGITGGWHPIHQTCNRVSWYLTNGEIPPDLQVCHRCDNPKCVRPDHLFLGTMDENQKDKINKNRQYRPSGEKHYGATLDEYKVRHIRYMKKEFPHMYDREIAMFVGCSRMQVSMVYHGKAWTHVP